MSTHDDPAHRAWIRIASRYDLAMLPLEWLVLRRWRRRIGSMIPTEAAVLDVGAGTGANIRSLPGHRAPAVVDWSLDMLLAGQRSGALDGSSVVRGRAEALPFLDRSFDAVISTLVFCSVPDPGGGFREIARVLRPGARLLLIEHVRPRPRLAGWIADRVSTFTARFWGEYFNRDTAATLEREGFAVRRIAHALWGAMVLLEAVPPENEAISRSV